MSEADSSRPAYVGEAVHMIDAYHMRLQICEYEEQIKKLMEKNTEMRSVLHDLVDYSRESDGLTGFHLNGAVLYWDDFDVIRRAKKCLIDVVNTQDLVSAVKIAEEVFRQYAEIHAKKEQNEQNAEKVRRNLELADAMKDVIAKATGLR